MKGLVDFGRDGPALIADSTTLGYRALGERVARLREELARLPRPACCFLFANNSVSWVVSYLACLEAGLPLGLGDPAVQARDRVIATYQPGAVMVEDAAPAPSGYVRRHDIGDGLSLWVADGDGTPRHTINPELALLLTTSGSTGDAKFVRLSAGNLAANALSIATYLNLEAGDRPIQSLPLHYSYGLSVLNSHLAVGAAIVLTRHSFLRPEFWRDAESHGCTSFAGVPYMYETLQRLRVSPVERGKIRTMTQAGGHLRPEVARQFLQSATKHGGRMFVMYGQTEATARIAYVPAERLAEKLGSIGLAIPGGELWLEGLEDDPTHHQLHYRGPNVMLGYAESPADLGKGDEMGGRLATGDLATVDSDGYFRITGRLARFAKLFGKRVSLAAVESEVESRFDVRTIALDGGERLKVFVETWDSQTPATIRSHLCAWLGVPPPAIEVVTVSELPMTSNGKKNYKALA